VHNVQITRTQPGVISPREVIAAADRLPDSVVDEVCGPGGLSGATEAQHRELVRLVPIVTNGRVVAWGRKEADSCEAGTRGCSIDHSRDDGSCEGW
jgi:hypothetical protein